MAEAASDIAAPSRTFCPRQRRRFVLVAAILASSMGFIDGSIVSIATPAIRATLPATLAEALWISNAYMLFLSSLILIGGAAGDRYGLRRVFMIGICVFTVASILCAIAPNAEALIVARAVKGIGAAIMVPGSLAIIAKAYPADERGKAIGIWAAASALTTAAGPILGGAALSVLGDSAWRLLFAINLPFGAIALAMLWFLVPPDEATGRRRLDLVGGGLITLALFVLAFGLTGGGGEGSVPGAGAVTLAIGLCAVLVVLFIWWERRCTAPMVPLTLFANRAFSGANMLTFTLYFGLSAMLFYLPMTVIGGWGVTEAAASLMFVPITVMVGLFSGRAGDYADRHGPAWPVTAGSLIVAMSYGVLALTVQTQNYWLGVMPLMAISAFGMALLVSPLSTAVMTSVGDDDTGTASGINNAVSRMAGLVAVAAMGLLAAALYPVLMGGGETSFGEIVENAAPSVARAHADATTLTFAAIAGVTAVLSAVSAAIAWTTLPRSGKADAG